MKSTSRAGLFVSLAIFSTLLLAGYCPAAPDTKPTEMFNGKDLTGWKLVGRGSNQWQFGRAEWDESNPKSVKVAGPGTELVNPARGANLSSEAVFGDCRVELEFMVGKATPGNDTDSNSGIKLQNIYEIQIFDSYGKETPGKLDCGAIYSETPPAVNACKKPGEWQKFVIEFQAPRFDANGKKTANAKFLKVTLNGVVVQDNVEIAHGTNVSRNAPEHPTGPLYLQGDHGSVAFRNLKVTPL